MVSVSPEELNTLWDELGNEDASKAYRALCTLVAAPKQSLPFLQQHLRSIPPVDHQRIGRLILDLDSDRFPVREKATQELNRFGELAGPALRNARAAKASAEARQRLEQLLTKREKNALSPEQLQVLRAIEVLEHIASDEARQVLAGLASGAPEARLTQEAKASLERLAKRP